MVYFLQITAQMFDSVLQAIKNQSIIHAAAGAFSLFGSSAIIASVVLVFQTKHKKIPNL
jgi:hypothetical protein